MEYNKIGWKDHVVEYPNRYVETDNGDGTITLTKDEGNVVQAGTPLSATNMDQMDQGIADLYAEMSEQAETPVTLKNGLQKVTTTAPGPFNVLYHGRTLVNLFVNDFGNFEKDSNGDGIADDLSKNAPGGSASLSTTDYSIGTQGQRMDISAEAADGSKKYNVNNLSNFKTGKYYVVLVDFVQVNNENVAIEIYKDGQFIRGNQNLSGYDGRGAETTNKITLALAFTFDTQLDLITFMASHASSYGASSFTIDAARAFEIDQQEHDDINAGLYTADEIAARYPYGERIMPVKNPVASVVGKNLVKPFYEWSTDEKVEILAPHEMVVHGNGNWSFNSTVVDIFGDITYTLLCEQDDETTYGMYYRFMDKNRDNITSDTTVSGNKVVLSAPSNARFLVVGYRTKATTDIHFKNPMLYIGDGNDDVFEPYNEDHEYIQADLYDGDYVFDQDSDYFKKSTKDLKVIDGSFGWTHNNDFSGFKTAKMPNITSKAITFLKDTGKIIPIGTYEQLTTYADYFYTDSNYHFVSVSDTDSGFTDGMTPTANMWKGYFNGWKYTGDGTTHTWASKVDGVAAATQTEAFVADPTNKPSGYIPHDLYCGLSTEVTSAVQGEFGLSLQEGGNHVRLRENVVINEKVTPYDRGDGYIFLNDTRYSSCLFEKMTNDVLVILKDGQADPTWNVYIDHQYGYGGANISKEDYDFDASATYEAIYIANQPFGASIIQADGVYNSSFKASYNQTVKDVADQQKINSRQDMQILEIMARLDAGGL